MRDMILRVKPSVLAGLLAVALLGMLNQASVSRMTGVVATAIALLSLNVLLGYTGQISLGQAAFVGSGGYVAIQLGGRGLPLPLVVLAAGLVGAALTAIVGLPSLRIRGLAVAIATLVYGIAATTYLFQQPWLTGADANLTLAVPFGRGPTFRLLLAAVVALVAVMALDRQLLRSKLGRAMEAVRDGEDRVVAFGVDGGVAKLRAYALSGFMAGMAGALVAYRSGTVVAAEFDFLRSLELLAFAVVGGMGSRWGVLAAAMVLEGLPQLFPPPEDFTRAVPMIGGIALILTVMFLPEGLGGLGARIKPLWRRIPTFGRLGAVIAGAVLVTAVALNEQAARNIDSPIIPPGATEGSAPTWPLILVIGLAVAWAVAAAARLLLTSPVGEEQTPERDLAPDDSGERAREAAHAATRLREVPRALSLRMPARTLFEATDVSVRFGGVQALWQISLEVRQGEIVGLIGANGAGKSTFYNVVSGFVTPEPGSSLTYRGRELLSARPSSRTSFGIARTFQHMGLMRPLTVEDNVLLAQHWLARYDDFAGVLRLGGVARTERELRDRAEKALRIFGLDHLRQARLGSLSYGTMRMVELASAVATGADLLFFDEASAGLGPEEAHALGDRFHALRDELGLTLVVIEHHVPLIARVCDYVYCLASGRQLAEGIPSSIQSNPDVIAEFLGRSQIDDGVRA